MALTYSFQGDDKTLKSKKSRKKGKKTHRKQKTAEIQSLTHCGYIILPLIELRVELKIFCLPVHSPFRHAILLPNI